MKKVLSFIVVMLFILSFSSTSVNAKSSNSLSDKEIQNLEDKVNEVLNEELGNAVYQSNSDSDVKVEIGEVKIELEQSTLELYDYDEDKIINAFKQEADQSKQELLETNIEVAKIESTQLNEVEPYSIIDKGSYYVARVWSGVPFVGWGYVNQDFTGRISDGKLRSLKTKGASYGTGITIGRWDHNRSWIEVHRYAVSADIFMKGTVHAVIKGSPVSYSSTFLKTVYSSDLK